MTDKLDNLFEMQIRFQERLGQYPSMVHSQPHISMHTLALIDEIMEALRETPWKPWKKNQQLEAQRFKDELVDAWHFLINLSLCAGLTSQELFDSFVDKNRENHSRQDKGY